MDRNHMISKVVSNEMLIRKAITKGHRPSDGDEFQPLRVENEILRCMYYGEDSPHCRRKYTK